MIIWRKILFYFGCVSKDVGLNYTGFDLINSKNYEYAEKYFNKKIFEV